MFAVLEGRKDHQKRKTPPPPLKLAPQCIPPFHGRKLIANNGCDRKEVDEESRYSLFAPLEASPNINLQLCLPIHSPRRDSPDPVIGFTFLCSTGSSASFSLVAIDSTEGKMADGAHEEAFVGHATEMQVIARQGCRGLTPTGLEPALDYAFGFQGVVRQRARLINDTNSSLKPAAVPPPSHPLNAELPSPFAGFETPGSSSTTCKTTVSTDNNKPYQHDASSSPPQSPRDLQNMHTTSPLSQITAHSAQNVNLPGQSPPQSPAKDPFLKLAERIMHRHLTWKEQAALMQLLGRRQLSSAPG
ncbi:hypothetical protein EDB81DRAFT_766586 [Dactylonectria macrodidyma]|uniref:Uncharacterized protein n=1 Tax=Dactylonectria macrodidyma TaxID=307937 RepID=A0A9P9IIH5_9HYPO|nr:hypothetical protein EDB81DRAFT_766586 [Dactylonectria macrodidyma]